MEINKGLTRTGRKNLSKSNGGILLSGGECQQKLGLETDSASMMLTSAIGYLISQQRVVVSLKPCAKRQVS